MDARKKEGGQERGPQVLSLTEESTERLMLRKFLTDPAYTSFIAENADAECFSNPVIKRGMQYAMLYRSKGYSKPLSAELLCEILQGAGFSEEAKLLPSYANFDCSSIDDGLARQVVKEYVQGRRTFNLVFSHSAEMMKARNFAPVLKGVQEIAAMEFETDLGFNYMQDLDEHVRYLTSPDSRMSTGYSQLDYLTSGGLPVDGKCLVVFMAQPGLGKSMMMHNLATNMVRMGRRVLVVSLEMTEQVYAARFSANFAGVNVNELSFDGNVSRIYRARDEVMEAHPDAGLVIKEFPPSSLRPAALGAYVERLKLSGFEPEVVFVDYLNIMVPNSVEKGDNTYVKVGETCKELRALSYRFGVPFVTATQTNRDGFDSMEVTMANVSESTQTAQHSDGIFALTSEGPESGLIDLTILKNRLGGRVGAKVKFAMDSATLRLTQVSEVSEADRSELERAAGMIAAADPE